MVVVVVAEVRSSNLAGPDGAARYSSGGGEGGSNGGALSRQGERRDVVSIDQVSACSSCAGAINSVPPLTLARSLVRVRARVDTETGGSRGVSE